MILENCNIEQPTQSPWDHLDQDPSLGHSAMYFGVQYSESVMTRETKNKNPVGFVFCFYV